MRDIRDIRSHEEFEEICHQLLVAEYPDYQPVAGEGGDEGIDGFRSGRKIIYQIKFSAQRLRPTEYLTDLDRLAACRRLKEWVLLISREPTPRLHDLVEAKAKQYGIKVTIMGRTAIEALLHKHSAIREKYFHEIAKEATVRGLYDHVASKDDLRRLEKEARAKRPVKLHATPPPGSLTPAHRKEITDGVDRIVRASRRKITHAKVFAMLKNAFDVDHWHWIPDSGFPDAMAWLHRFSYGVKGQYAPRDSAARLMGVIHSQRRHLGLSDREYRGLFIRLTGVDSTTKMDLRQLQMVRDQLNLMIARESGWPPTEEGNPEGESTSDRKD